MPWYVLFLFLIALIILVLSIPVRLRFQVGHEEGFAIQISIGPIVLLRLPEKEKPIDLKQFTYTKHQKRLAKEAKKQKKKEKPTKKSALRQSIQNGTAQAKKKDNELDGMLHLLRTFFKLLPSLYGSMHCRIYQLIVIVGGEDAADVALHYGILSQSLACLLEYLRQSSHMVEEPEDLVVRANFLAKQTIVQGDLCFQLRLGALIKILFKTVAGNASQQSKKA